MDLKMFARVSLLDVVLLLSFCYKKLFCLHFFCVSFSILTSKEFVAVAVVVVVVDFTVFTVVVLKYFRHLITYSFMLHFAYCPFYPSFGVVCFCVCYFISYLLKGGTERKMLNNKKDRCTAKTDVRNL